MDDEWLPIRRAGKILQPIVGDILIAQDRILDALRWGEINCRTSRASPYHENASLCGSTDLDSDWFVQLQAEPAGNVDWRDFLYDGGIEVTRSGVEKLCHLPRRNRVAASAKYVAEDGPDWHVPHVIAWIATRDIDTVAGAQKPFALGGINSVGWLIKSVADNWCRCKRIPQMDEEKWEVCVCIDRALEEMRKNILAGKLNPTRVPKGDVFPPLSAGGIHFDRKNLRFIFPQEVETVSFIRSQVEKLWRPMAQSMSKDPPVSAADLKRWYDVELTDDERQRDSEDQSWEKARKKFPRNRVTREVVRKARGTKKRGPKAFREKIPRNYGEN